VEIWHGGFLVRRESWVYNAQGSFEQVDWTTCTYTVDGRLSGRTSSNGVGYSATWYGSRKSQESDETGLVTTFGYDALDGSPALRTPRSGSLPAQQTTYEYDAADRLRFTRVGPAGGEQIVTETQYDTGGRVKKVINPDGVTTDLHLHERGPHGDGDVFSGPAGCQPQFHPERQNDGPLRRRPHEGHHRFGGGRGTPCLRLGHQLLPHPDG